MKPMWKIGWPIWLFIKALRFVRQIPDCTNPSGISMVLFSFNQNVKIRFVQEFVSIWIKFIPRYWIPPNSTVYTAELHGIQYCGKNFDQNWHKPYFSILIKWKQYRGNSGWMGTFWNLMHELLWPYLEIMNTRSMVR